MSDRLPASVTHARMDGRDTSLRFQRRIRELRAERDGLASYVTPVLYDESGFPLRRRQVGGVTGRIRELLSR